MMSVCRIRVLRLLAGGLVLLQVGSCSFAEFNEFLQTVFLGITAAGGVAILQNV